MSDIKILIVEDDMIAAADISMQLDRLGYEVSGICPRGEDALKNIESTRPDIVLMDVNLKGALNGVETAQRIGERFQIPLIFLTANSDSGTFNRAKATKPYAFISKPFQETDLQRAIELTIERIDAEQIAAAPPSSADEISETPFFLDDRIFVRHHDRMVKVFLHEVLFIEAERSYCKLHTDDKEYLLSVPLGALENKLPRQTFMRVHRSFVVNLAKIDALTAGQEFLLFGKKQVPVSANLKEELMAHLRMV